MPHPQVVDDTLPRSLVKEREASLPCVVVAVSGDSASSLFGRSSPPDHVSSCHLLADVFVVMELTTLVGVRTLLSIQAVVTLESWQSWPSCTAAADWSSTTCTVSLAGVQSPHCIEMLSTLSSVHVHVVRERPAALYVLLVCFRTVAL